MMWLYVKKIYSHQCINYWWHFTKSSFLATRFKFISVNCHKDHGYFNGYCYNLAVIELPIKIMKDKLNEVVPSPADIFSTEYVFENLGTPFVIGLAVGYFAKKMLLISLLLLGAAIVLLFASEYLEITQINYTKLEQAVQPATSAAKSFKDFLLSRLSNFPSKGLSATAGFVVGFKLG